MKSKIIPPILIELFLIILPVVKVVTPIKNIIDATGKSPMIRDERINISHETPNTPHIIDKDLPIIV